MIREHWMIAMKLVAVIAGIYCGLTCLEASSPMRRDQ